MAKVYRRGAARRDLIVHYAYLAEHAGETMADHFLTLAEATFNELAEAPRKGSLVATRQPMLSGLRRWRVREFENVLIFYLPRDDGISVVRVLHGARDWWSLLGLDQ